MADEASLQQELVAENARLVARVEALETEIAALRTDTAHAVAHAQETLYWFERWGVDFNSLFARREMEYLRKGVRGARMVFRKLVQIKRRLAG